MHQRHIMITALMAELMRRLLALPTKAERLACIVDLARVARVRASEARELVTQPGMDPSVAQGMAEDFERLADRLDAVVARGSIGTFMVELTRCGVLELVEAGVGMPSLERALGLRGGVA